MKIVLENIHKSYGKRTIVSRVNLFVSQGEIVGLLGPNGAGKTTTFYIGTGLEKPNQGTVWLNDIFRQLSVRDNILLVLEQTKVPRHLWKERVDFLLHEFRLEKVASSVGVQLSGGERRRAELARALASGIDGPQFLFLDEPFAGVDPIAVREIQEIVAKLRVRGIGILITDHNVRETLAITDRAYIMRDGQILASGIPEELYTNPLVRQYYLGDTFVR
jgi:lipopolysaccharide export system ATP-binding protein